MKIAVVTGTRAEYGLLYGLMKKLQYDDLIEFQLIVTGMHLSPEFGLTYQMIEEDGFTITRKVEMLLSSDTPAGISKSIGLGVIGFADAYEELQPDLIVVLGDRYEILAAVQAALPANIPVAHIAGGDTTEGAIDESIRHAITKMSHLHFVTNDKSYQNVIQMGENPKHVYNVGSPGIDNIKNLSLLSREELENNLGISIGNQSFLITLHPATLAPGKAEEQCESLLTALDLECSYESITLIFTKANADSEGRIINNMIEEYCLNRSNAYLFESLGQLKYLSMIQQVNVVIGNSSSGLYEVPSFQKPTVNIGDRQKGRLKALSVLDCDASADSIHKSIKDAKRLDCRNVTNPYGEGDSSQKIYSFIKKYDKCSFLLKKSFHEVSNT
ncbi:UDP-N-acetylglucosamine 2-epimerase [Salibacterium qingdaonense]|uniref:UDP-N-acetylglucosamine 2-epimerase (Non-hydrolysing) n=1 Tax=Salibacterium qingdaonense TaxID=266892 RepID=A0A1I4L0N0_9BACI|nr:UDP-N-acetylglucosamine 2-epimerase [Salibacterium qingdaonense]SFL84187.1 UDP-N-acetylglucosamine 2-epimerase (non-hydrolysing) [Salibacterium qingdaonense]